MKPTDYPIVKWAMALATVGFLVWLFGAENVWQFLTKDVWAAGLSYITGNP